MVDAIVSYAVERLGNYLIQEANTLGGFRDEVESLKNDLQWMKCFVKDAEAKQSGNDLIRQWVSNIRDISYDAEDVIDKYMLSVGDDAGGFSSINKLNLYRKGKEKVTMYGIGKQIQGLKKRLEDVSRRRESFGLQNMSSDTREMEKHDLNRLKQLRRATSFQDEEIYVGLKDDTDVLLAKLLDNEEPRRVVVSIYGTGGLGKTTLARKLYHNNDVKKKFKCCAWVSVSQDYKLKDLLLRIIKSFNFVNETREENLEKKTDEDLERSIHKSLQGYSYLMVLDDVWDKDDWVSLRRAFPENNHGSRVIITTRIKGVAERSDDNYYVHELPFLRRDESWQLFCEKAFRNSNAEQGLEELGREMVQKCRGLPLAIVVLGGLLATKKPQEWRLVRDHLWRHLRSDSIEISHLLDLSFNEMSYQLRLCFLYLGLFPEDFEIDVKRLIRLLVAEDFIPQTEDGIMEEIVEDNLNELINRSLIQVEKRCWGRVATFRVHDLLRDLAIQKAKELNFIHIFDKLKSSNRSSVVSSCRRQAIYTPVLSWLDHANSLSRSLLFFYQQLNQPSSGSESEFIIDVPLFTRFMLLRVFYVEHELHTTLRRLSKRIGKLTQLKYLRFKSSEVSSLPSSIVNLQKLQTLELSTDNLFYMELPKEINMMQELRHLIGKFGGTLPIENLSNLQTLKYVEAASWNKVDPAKLVSLRELHIVGSNEFVEFSFESIAKLKNIRILTVNLTDYSCFTSMEPLSHCHCLQDLRLNGKMKKLPKDLHVFLKNLECLRLWVSYLEKDPMRVLEKLPNLTILDLHIKYENIRKLSCTANGFPRLEILQLHANGIEEWQVEEGALPRLRGLEIPFKPTLKIPERLRSLPLPAKWEFGESWNHF